MKELKSEKICIRLTETMVSQINKCPGIKFSEKLEGLIELSLNQKPRLEKELDELTTERDNLLKQIDRLRDIRDQVNSMIYSLSILEENMRDTKGGDINVMIEKAGYNSNPEVIGKIKRLNQLTGKQHTMEQINDAFYENTYVKAADLIDDINNEFRTQELSEMGIAECNRQDPEIAALA